MKKALIIGGAGFIGLHLARRLLSDGVRVDIVDDFSRGKDDLDLQEVLKGLGARSTSVDFSSEGASDGLPDDYDYMFHLAAILGVANVISRSLDTLVLNVKLTFEAIRLARRQKALRSFTFASTSEVYAGSLSAGLLQFPTPEDSTIALPSLKEPRSSYLMSKLYGEAIVQQSGVPSVIVRPHNVYGPRMGTEHVIPELMKRISGSAAGEKVKIYSPHHSRTFCFVDDAVEMIYRLAQDDRAVGEIWNIGCETPEYEILKLASLVRDVVGIPVELVPFEDTAGSPSRRCPSMQRTDARTGHHSRVPLASGLNRTYEWYAKRVFSSGVS